MSYQVFVDENGAYQDPDARSRHGAYETAAEAIAICQKMVDDDLDEVREPGMSGGQALTRWKMWGRDPFIVTAAGAESVKFSAWDYAEAKAAALNEASADKPGPVAQQDYEPDAS